MFHAGLPLAGRFRKCLETLYGAFICVSIECINLIEFLLQRLDRGTNTVEVLGVKVWLILANPLMGDEDNVAILRSLSHTFDGVNKPQKPSFSRLFMCDQLTHSFEVAVCDEAHRVS